MSVILCQQENIYATIHTVETNNNPENKGWIGFDPKVNQSFLKKKVFYTNDKIDHFQTLLEDLHISCKSNINNRYE